MQNLERTAPESTMMQAKKAFVVTTSADRPLARIAGDLSDLGFRVDRILEEIGVIVITGDAAAAQRIRTIPGIADVAPATEIDIGPPDSPIS